MRRLLAVVVGFFALLAPVLVAVSSPSSAVGEASGGVFVPVTPFRLAYTANGTGGYATPIGAGVTRSYTVAGVGGVPSSGVSAVVIDIAATKATVADTALRVWAKGEPMPTTSSILRFGGSDPMVSNTAIVPLGTGGGISIWNNHGLTDYNIDVQGYFTTESDASSTGGFVAFDAPVRVMNSLAGLGSPDPRLTAGTNYDVQVTGDDIPADATAVFVNVKVDTDSGSSGGLQIGEGGTTISGLPAAVNYVGGNKWSDTGLAVKLSTDGKLRIRNATAGGTPAVYIDVQGYFSGDPDEGGSYTPVTQVNLGQVSIPAQDSVTFQAADVGELPDAETLGSVTLTVFAYNWSAFGSVRVYNPDGEEPDNRGNVTFNTTMNSTTGATSTALVETSTDGEIAVLNTSTQPVSVRLTTQGWFTRRADQDQVGPAMTSLGVDEYMLEDLSVVADNESITLQQAVDQYGWQNEFTKDVETLAESFPESFAYAEIASTGTPRAMVQFKGGVPDEATAVLSDLEVPVELTGSAMHSAEERETLTAAASSAIAEIGGPDAQSVAVYDSATRDVVATVYLPPGDSDQPTQSAMRASVEDEIESIRPALDIPGVRIEIQHEPLAETQALVGGATLGNGANVLQCTSGFPAYDKSNGRRGLLTARHCPNYFHYYFSREGRLASASVFLDKRYGDIQFNPLVSPVRESLGRSFYYKAGKTRRVLGSRSPACGQKVCRYGRGSNKYSCTTVLATGASVNYGNGWKFDGLVVTRRAADSAGGDSGGPWFSGGYAVGLHSGRRINPFATDNAYFTPVSRISKVGVALYK